MFDCEKYLDEYTLIYCTQQGNAEAFNPLVTKYQNRIYTYILKHVKDPETAKDLTQETFLKAFAGLSSFRGDSAFSSWLYRIAKNLCIDYHRKQKTKSDILPLHTIDERRITDTHPDPSQNMETQELRRVLWTAIQYLPSMRKKVFLLRYAQELPIKDIATRLKKSEGTVKTHLYKAHHQLRELLTPYLKNEDIPWLPSWSA